MLASSRPPEDSRNGFRIDLVACCHDLPVRLIDRMNDGVFNAACEHIAFGRVCRGDVSDLLGQAYAEADVDAVSRMPDSWTARMR